MNAGWDVINLDCNGIGEGGDAAGEEEKDLEPDLERDLHLYDAAAAAVEFVFISIGDADAFILGDVDVKIGGAERHSFAFAAIVDCVDTGDDDEDEDTIDSVVAAVEDFSLELETTTDGCVSFSDFNAGIDSDSFSFTLSSFLIGGIFRSFIDVEISFEL
jgi:hypothetical protein